MNSIKDTLCLVYITVGSIKEANFIGRILVEKELVACVNILSDMISIYKWEGEIEEGVEVVIIAKTCKELIPRIIKTVKKIHSYTCPCILELPILGGNSDFLSWIRTETLKNN